MTTRRLPSAGLRRLAEFALILAASAALLAIANRWSPQQSSLDGFRAIDGDSLRRGDEEIRLYGIDAPELQQTCRNGQGRDYPCGRLARDHLASLLAAGTADCTILDVDRYQRAVSRCSAGGEDLGGAMVMDGWAVAYLMHALNYAPAEAKARAARRGLWAGDFEMPEDWRRRHRQARSSLAGGERLPPD